MIDSKLRKIIDNQTAGILWLTTKPLSLTHPNIEEIDYFFDRVILNTAKNSKHGLNKSKNLFYSTSYAHSFFLLQATIQNESEFKNSLIELKALIDYPDGPKKILLIDENKKASTIAEAQKILKNFQILEIKS